MKLKKGLYIKGKMMLVLLFSTLFAFGSIVFTFFKSSKIDQENVKVIEVAEKMKNEVLEARIILDEYKLFQNENLYPKIFKHLGHASKNIQALKKLMHLADERTLDSLHNRLLDHVNQAHSNIVNLEKLIRSEAKGKAGNQEVIEAYHDFSISFNNFDIALHDYVSERNANFNQTVYFLLLASFLILLVCLLIIANQANALLRSERELVRKTVEVEQKERHRIARDLHDGLGALLSSIGIYANILARETQNQPEVNEKMKEIRNLSNSALQTVQEVINNLNPADLLKNGLVVSIEKLCRKMNQLGNVGFHLNSTNYSILLPQGTKLILYRICSELINNTLKHSNAGSAHIKLYNEKNTIFLNYADNGDGFDLKNTDLFQGEKMGLKNIRNRVDALGGICKMESNPGQGINISIQFNYIS